MKILFEGHLNPTEDHKDHSTIVLRGFRVPSIGPPLCREVPASQTAAVSFSSLGAIFGGLYSERNLQKKKIPIRGSVDKSPQMLGPQNP